MMVETHLGPNTEVHQTHLKEVTGVIYGSEGNTPPPQVTFISPPSDMIGTDQITHTLLYVWTNN